MASCPTALGSASGWAFESLVSRPEAGQVGLSVFWDHSRLRQRAPPGASFRKECSGNIGRMYGQQHLPETESARSYHERVTPRLHSHMCLRVLSTGLQGLRHPKCGGAHLVYLRPRSWTGQATRLWRLRRVSDSIRETRLVHRVRSQPLLDWPLGGKGSQDRGSGGTGRVLRMAWGVVLADGQGQWGWLTSEPARPLQCSFGAKRHPESRPPQKVQQQ